MSEDNVDEVWERIHAPKHRVRNVHSFLRKDMQFAAWWIGVPTVLSGAATWAARKDLNFVILTCWAFAGIFALLLLALGIFKFLLSRFAPAVQFKGTIIVGLITATVLLVPLYVAAQGIGRR